MSHKKPLPLESLSGRQLVIGTGRDRTRRTFKWTDISSNTEITRSSKFWHVRSSASEEYLLKYLRLRFFWRQASDLEKQMAFSHPRFLKDVEFNVLLTLLATTELRRSEIIWRMESALSLLGKKSNFRKVLLDQWDSNIHILADLETRTILKHKAYSGYVRNSSSVGSKRSHGTSTPEPILEAFSEDKFEEYEILYELCFKGKYETSSATIEIFRRSHKRKD